jgi:predicted DNA repair protein MutK
MLGGAYLCYEGTEKVAQWLFPHAAHAHEANVDASAGNSQALEDQKVASAIKTDFILSAEIMAISLAAVPEAGFWSEALVLAVVAVGITAVVYGGVALIVKADDVGLALASNRSPSSFAALGRGIGRALVTGMPVFLKILAVVGTAAMVWVGGGILVHGLEEYGIVAPAHLIHDASAAVTAAAGGILGWLVTAAGSGIVGLAVGAALIPLVGKVIGPLWKRLRGSPAAAA